MEPVKIFYGTAWKEERTEALTTLAIANGFNVIDTANQRKHYHEVGVGEALKRHFASGAKRESIYIQTKFTYQRGQDHRLPYDPKADTETQVRQSFASSLEHLGVNYLDSLLIHGPEMGFVLSANDQIVWKTMESLCEAGKVRHIGVSNFGARQLLQLLEIAKLPITYVQNRCYPSIRWDPDVRRICREKKIGYQGFSLIRDPLIVESLPIRQMAAQRRSTIAQVIYKFAHQAGMIVMAGTTNEQHMREALAALELPDLNESEMAHIEGLGG